IRNLCISFISKPFSEEEQKVKAAATQQPGTSTKQELPNPNLVRKVLHQLLPIFCEIFQRSLNGVVRRTSLSLMRKIVENIGDLRQSAVSDEGVTPNSARKMSADVSNAAESLVAVVVSVLDQEDDHEGHEQVLLILQSLLEKDADLWVTELIRLGVFERVEAMAQEPPKGLEEVLKAIHLDGRSRVAPMEIDFEHQQQPSSSAAGNEIMDTTPVADVPEGEGSSSAAEVAEPETSTPSSSSQQSIPKPKTTASSSASSAILQVVSKLSGVASLDKSAAAAAADKKPSKIVLNQGTPYRWKEWRIVRGPSSLFIWSDVLLIELPFQSNGWFRYLADNDFHVQFVTGTANVDQQMTDEEKVEVPAWEMWSAKSSELQIKSISSSNPSGQANTMVTTIKVQDDAGGFMFETGTGRKTNVMPEYALPIDFHTGWSAHGVTTRKIKFRQDIQKRKVQELAWKLWNDHLREAHAKPREALLKLEEAARTIEVTLRKLLNAKPRVSKQPVINKLHKYMDAMETVYTSVIDDRRLSTFEFSVSGIVPVIFALLSSMDKYPDVYRNVFIEKFSKGDALSKLALKMVAVLEASEKFPQYLYDSPGGSSFGLQLLSRRVRTKLEMIPRNDGKDHPDEQLVDKTGKIVKCEPLASIGSIRTYLMKMVARQWHDRDRSKFRYVKEIQELKQKGEAVVLRYVSDFDENGVIYWIGTNGRTAPSWSNPSSVKAVKITCSDARQPFGKPDDLLSRDQNPINCHTSDDKNAHFTIDLGLFVVPTSYTLRHSRGYGRSALRNWILQGSLDAKKWENVIVHVDDKSLGEPGSTASWHVAEKGTNAYRYYRIAQNGKNSSGQTHYLSCSGFEIYGDIVDVVAEAICEEAPKKESVPGTSSAGSSSSAAPLTKEQVIEMLPAREHNNKLKSGITLDSLVAMMQRSRNRIRGTYKISESKSKVVRGKDWRWEEQDGGEGKFVRIISPPENGWVDVTWDNGYSNSYRFGASGHFDIERVTSSGHRYSTPPFSSNVPSSVSFVHYDLNKHKIHYSTGYGRGPKKSCILNRQNLWSIILNVRRSNFIGASTLSRFSSVKNTTPSGTSSSGGSSGGAIGKKSMSTTNLVDERQKASGPSVASTGQAASAESLQHQTPSLENLLARAMPQTFGRIAENQEQEDEPMGGEESDSAASMRSAASSTSQVSTGSSQQQQQQQQDPDLTPRDSAGTPSTPRDDKNQALSVSAPDLAAARQRQASAEAERM
ncbi:hypothetical protein CAEBREN_30160, partial [Caenorhabditis brenneri]